MTGRRDRRPATPATPPTPAAPAGAPPGRSGARALGEIVLLRGLGLLAGRARAFYAALVMAALGAVLVAGWAMGPGRWALAREMAAMTARATGRIDRAWWRLDVDARLLDDRVTNWRAVATIQACADVAFQAGDAPAAVVLCSARLPFQAWWHPLTTTEIVAGVPFGWPTDERGLPRILLRIPEAGLRKLEARPGGLVADLWRQLDRPIDLIVHAWSDPPERTAIPLAFAPGHPGAALPAAVVGARGRIRPTGFVLVAVGALAWVGFVHVWRAPDGRVVRWAVAIVPLLLLPWWGERLPVVLRWMLPESAEVFTEVTRNVSPLPGALGRLTPADVARLADAERPWTLDRSVYAGTLGRVPLRRPAPGAVRPDDALAALTGQVTDATLARPDAELAALLERLAADQGAGRQKASLVFIPAARRAALDERRSEAVRRAALAFLDVCLTSPRDDPDPRGPAFEGRLAIWASLLDFPVAHIRNRAAWVFEHVGRPVPRPATP